MASGIFIGLTECELLDIKAKALSMITEGKTLMSYSDSGSSASKQFARRTTIISTDWQNRND